MKKPSGSLVAYVQWDVNVIGNDKLAFGGFWPGIGFSWRNCDTDGDWQLIQMGRQTYRYFDPAQNRWKRSEGTDLDLAYPCPNLRDSPYTELLPVFSQATADGSFTTYLAFRPTPDDILVPIRQVTWFWRGSAQNTAVEWQLTSDPTDHSRNPISDAPAENPTVSWNGLIQTGLNGIPIPEP